ncbi:MAG: tetratricopeptide repeat protein [Planctomycetota bacterium]
MLKALLPFLAHFPRGLVLSVWLVRGDRVTPVSQAAPPTDEQRAAWSTQLAGADRASDEPLLEKIAAEWLEQDPTAPDPYYWRGRSRFRRGEIAACVKDFDRLVELAPRREPSQWERGIALYYAGEFARGAKQFELYQTYDNRDVENSVWRYLCLARDQGVAKARATMLPIEGDRRVPMMTIYELYRGKKQPEDVLQDAHAGEPPADILAGRLFYAHLYLGLFFEAQGDAAQARKYLTLAADKALRTKPGVNSDMWSVADVHAQRLAKQK